MNEIKKAGIPTFAVAGAPGQLAGELMLVAFLSA